MSAIEYIVLDVRKRRIVVGVEVSLTDYRG